MKNVTLAIDEGALQAGREYARQHHTTLNNLIRQYLSELVAARPQGDWVDTAFAIADQTGADSGGRSWTREDLYDA